MAKSAHSAPSAPRPPAAVAAFTHATLTALFDAMPSGVAYLRLEVEGDAEPDFTLLYANPVFHKLIGFPLAVGSRWSTWPGADASKDHTLRRLLAQVVNEEGSRTLEHFLPPLNKWFSANVYSPNPGHVMLVFSDASSARNADAALRKSEQQQRALLEAQAYAELILESMGEGLCQVDNMGLLTYISPAGAKLLGYEPAEVIGKPAHALYHHSYPDGSHYPAEACGMLKALHTGVPCTRDDEVFWRKDGSSFPVHYVSSPMVVGGHQHGTVVTFRDISEEARIRRALLDNEAKLQQMNETLESRVRERTRELVLALESAETAKRSRGLFLANMSHEIRTPMNSVIGMVYLALKTEPNPTQRDFLEKIHKSGVHLLSIINDILDFSKIDAGKLKLESGTFDLEQVLQHMLTVAGDKAAEKGLTLRLEVGADVPGLLRGDAVRLGQILINLLNNAIKFTARGGVVIRVQRRPALPGPDTAESCPLHFEVQDSGIGIDESQRARLFESFEQGDQSTTRNFGGTGLGLAISRQLAHLMDGEIGMASRLGEGSTFWFDARFQIAHEARQQVRPPTSVQDAINALRGKQVLVVDDNDFNLDVARGLLEDIGVQVATAENGAQAVDAVRQTHFDCVLMDMQMPVMDGLVATRTIRSQPATAGMVVIAMTANAGQEDQRLCMQAGMNQVLTKPIEPDLLFLALAHWLQAIGPPSVPLARRAVSEVPGIQPVPADASALPVWDARALTRMVGDNQAAHARLLDKYLLTAGETLATLRSCANACQWTGVADQAHKLKSSSRSVGAMQLGALCETLERAGRGSSGDQCATLVQSVEQCFAQVQSQISAHRSAS